MKTIKLAAKYLIVIAAVLWGCVSCAGLEIVTHTPYGSVNYKDDVINVTPNTTPIAIPIYGTK
jgi:hypothetical protein